MPAGTRWQLEFNGDTGLAAAIDMVADEDGEHNVVSVADYLSKSVLVFTATQERFIVETLPIGGERVFSLDDSLCKHRACTLTLQVGSANAELQWIAFAFGRARECNMRLFWSLHGLYQALRMTCYKNRPSEWCARRGRAFTAMFEEVIGPGQMVYSTHLSKNTPGQHARPFFMRCLPTQSISTGAVMLLLVKFAFASKEQGGIDSDSSREAARLILKAFLLQFVCMESKELVLVADDLWQPYWPRASTFSSLRSKVFSITVTPGLLFDMTALGAIASEGAGSETAAVWWKRLTADLLGEAGAIGWQRLFSRLATRVSCRGFLSQLIYRISVALELNFGAQCKHKRAEGRCSVIKCRWPDLEDALGDAEAVHKYLAKYALNTSIAGADHKEFGISTDEGDVQALKLQASAIILKTNECIVPTPQVP